MGEGMNAVEYRQPVYATLDQIEHASDGGVQKCHMRLGREISLSGAVKKAKKFLRDIWNGLTGSKKAFRKSTSDIFHVRYTPSSETIRFSRGGVDAFVPVKVASEEPLYTLINRGNPEDPVRMTPAQIRSMKAFEDTVVSQHPAELVETAASVKAIAVEETIAAEEVVFQKPTATETPAAIEQEIEDEVIEVPAISVMASVRAIEAELEAAGRTPKKVQSAIYRGRKLSLTPRADKVAPAVETPVEQKAQPDAEAVDVKRLIGMIESKGASVPSELPKREPVAIKTEKQASPQQLPPRQAPALESVSLPVMKRVQFSESVVFIPEAQIAEIQEVKDESAQTLSNVVKKRRKKKAKAGSHDNRKHKPKSLEENRSGMVRFGANEIYGFRSEFRPKPPKDSGLKDEQDLGEFAQSERAKKVQVKMEAAISAPQGE